MALENKRSGGITSISLDKNKAEIASLKSDISKRKEVNTL
jgi:hypothetical protein